MNTLIVVNGEQYWQDYFPGYQVHNRRLQSSKWLYDDDKLWVIDSNGVLRVDAVLWRVGAIRPHASHRAVLEMIRLSGIPCMNSTQVLLRGFDRLSMLNEMRDAGLPVIAFSVAVGEQILDKFQPSFPSVLKVGNYHTGFGKAKVTDNAQWNDLKDLMFVTEEYITVEPYIDYVLDIRCLAIGDKIWAMSRRSNGWKANTGDISYQLIDLPEILREHTSNAMLHLKADMLGLDFLQTQDGTYILLESNDIPGLAGFPDAVFDAVSTCMRRKIEGSS